TLSVGRKDPGVVAIRDWLYVLGGATPTVVATIERAPIGADGRLGSFQQLSDALAAPSAGMSVEIIGNQVYLLGGSSGAVSQRAAIGPGGVLGGFFPQSGSLTKSRAAHAGFVAGNYYYLAGGSDTSGPALEHADINASGQLDAWAGAGTLLAERDGMGIAVSGDRLWSVGGWRVTMSLIYFLSELDSAPIAPDGTVGTFAQKANTN